MTGTPRTNPGCTPASRADAAAVYQHGIVVCDAIAGIGTEHVNVDPVRIPERHVQDELQLVVDLVAGAVDMPVTQPVLGCREAGRWRFDDADYRAVL
jgi:hypothetical protein